MNPNDHTEMYIDGYNAALAGDPISSNPYCLKRSVKSWRRGYDAGLKELWKRQEQARKAQTTGVQQ